MKKNTSISSSEAGALLDKYRVDGSVFVCTSAPGTATGSRIDRQWTVRDINTGLVKGKPVLKVRQHN